MVGYYDYGMTLHIFQSGKRPHQFAFTVDETGANLPESEPWEKVGQTVPGDTAMPAEWAQDIQYCGYTLVEWNTETLGDTFKPKRQ